MIERLDHVNIVVADMEAMIRFYRDLLGLQLAKQATISGPWISAVTGLAEVTADVAFLQPPGGSGIELIRYRTPAGADAAGGAPNATGIRHIALRVRDIDQLVRAMAAGGVAFFSPVQDVPGTQVDYAQEHKRLVYCRDPEGNLLEFCEFS
jgi:catechol 2,3-dioxygenase-like lactoylglutathione lyase family enzyme